MTRAVDKAYDAVREIIKRTNGTLRGRLPYSEGTDEVFSAILAFGWLPPEAVAEVELATLKRCAKIASSLTPMPPDSAYASYRYARHVHGVDIAAAILAMAVSNSTWQEVKEGGNTL